MGFLIEQYKNRENKPLNVVFENGKEFKLLEFSNYLIYLFFDNYNGLSYAEDEQNLYIVDGYISKKDMLFSNADFLKKMFQANDFSCLNKLNGHYSAAILSKKQKSILFVDYLGIGRAFHFRQNGVAYYSSCLSYFINHPRIQLELDHHELTNFIINCGDFSSNKSIYKNVSRLYPGEYLTLDISDGKIENYSAFEFSSKRDTLDKNELTETLKEILNEYYDEHCYLELSGGLDSSTNVSIICKLLGKKPETISFYSSMSGGQYDERVYQNEVIEKYNLTPNQVDVDNFLQPFSVSDFNNDLPLQPTLSILSGQPLRNYVKDYVLKTALTSCISGSGGDQVFYGDLYPPVYIRDLLCNFNMRDWFHNIKLWSNNFSYKELLKISFSKDANPFIVNQLPQFNKEYPLWLNPLDTKQLNESKYIPSITATSFSDSFYLNTCHLIGFYLGNSLSCRKQMFNAKFPLLDRRLINLMLTTEMASNFNPDRDRIIQREALRDILPEKVRTRVSKGGASRPELLLFNKHWPSFEPFISGEKLESLGIINKQYFMNTLEKLRCGFVGYGFNFPMLLAAINLEVWIKLHAERKIDYDIKRCISASNH